MIIFSNHSKEEVFKMNLHESQSHYNAYKGGISLSFGKHIMFKSFEDAVHSIVYANISTEFSSEAIIDDFDRISKDEVYVYEVVTEEAMIKRITLNELLSSDSNDMFTIGCLLASRKVYRSMDTMLEEELDIDNETIFNLDKETLKNLILKRDTYGQASLIGEILLGDNSDERLYHNTIKLDTTGDLSYVFIQQSGSYIEDVANKVVDCDKNGDLIIDLLNWTNDDPIVLAEKIVSIKNPFKTIDFINRYAEYLDNVREDKSDTGFVQNEKKVMNYLNESLINVDYSEINFKELVNNRYYEQPLSVSVFELLNILKTNSKNDSARAMLEGMKEYFNNDFLNEFNDIIYKNKISKVQSYDLDGIIIIVINVNDKFFITRKTRHGYLKFCEHLMCNTADYIRLSDLM